MENKEKIYKLAKEARISDGKLNDEYLFTIQAVDYFYYNRNIGEQDIRECFVDGTSDGGIDYIFVKDDIMHLIQGKSTNRLTYEDIRNLFFKMDETIRNFESGEFDQYSSILKSKYLNAYDTINDDKNINLVLFTNTDISDELYERVNNLKSDDKLINYNIIIYDIKEIENKIINLQQGYDFIKEDSIDLAETNNALRYGNSGIIVNIKASSLKRLYTKQNSNGLFSYNLREHIAQKNVDSGIENTIKNERGKFWFYNNGITIGCSDYSIDGYKLKLYDFSIINGAQTTTKIGESKIIDKDHDFALVCKIVRAEDDLKTESNFIMKISEASNSQKPIKPRDLKANTIEQKKLQINAKNNKYPLAIEIKRGVKPDNYYKVESWQRVTNEYIGQLIAGCILQKPGLARSGKSSLFTSDKIYNEVYKREHDYNVLYELVKIADKYDEFKREYTKINSNVDEIAVCSNGKFVVLSIIFYLYKYFNGVVDNCFDENLFKYNIRNTNLTMNYKEDDFDETLKSLFKFVLRELKRFYETKKESLKLTSYSNFFKTDKTYQEVILLEFDNILKDEYDKERLVKYMRIFDINQDI